jgi:hypothetical protein
MGKFTLQAGLLQHMAKAFTLIIGNMKNRPAQ